jgi:hypothetical protein
MTLGPDSRLPLIAGTNASKSENCFIRLLSLPDLRMSFHGTALWTFRSVRNAPLRYDNACALILTHGATRLHDKVN